MDLLGLEPSLSYLLPSRADTSEPPQTCETAPVSHLATPGDPETVVKKKSIPQKGP